MACFVLFGIRIPATPMTERSLLLFTDNNRKASQDQVKAEKRMGGKRNGSVPYGDLACDPRLAQGCVTCAPPDTALSLACRGRLARSVTRAGEGLSSANSAAVSPCSCTRSQHSAVVSRHTWYIQRKPL